MSFYSTQRLWNQEQQNATVFNWGEILEQWNQSLNMPPYVQVLIDNLKATSDPHSNYDFPLTHFLKYMNYEPKALTWFLYEAVSLRWMWGESRLDYVEELIKRPEMKLNEGFPVFPGSPLSVRTVRRFLKDSLSEEEQEFIGLSNTHAVVAPPAPPAPVANRTKTYAPMAFHFQRPDVKGKGQPDDVIRIYKESFCTYSIKYIDGQEKSSSVINDLGDKEVVKYLRNVINCNYFDTEPFQFIQMTLPGAPAVLFDGDMCAEARCHIYDAVERTMENWPEKCE